MKEFVKKLIGRLEEKENETVLKAPNTSDISNTEYQKWMMKSYGFKESIEIINQLAEEYEKKNKHCYFIKENEKLKQRLNSIYGKNGNGIIYADTDCIYKVSNWISCSERMPELFQECMWTVNRKKHPDAPFDIILGKYEPMKEYDQWKSFCLAWQPLPEPYEEV